MCELASWVEADGKIYLLTDNEVFSSQGRKALAGCQDNDVLGHGAIRKYWCLGTAGTDYERRDWWHRDVPKEVRDAVPRMQRMLQQALQTDDLAYIACEAPLWAARRIANMVPDRFRVSKDRRTVYADGKRWYDREYADGKLVRVRGWHANGKRRYVYEYTGGQLVRQRGWHANGKHWYDREYDDGELVRERGWYADGKRECVYEYADGQPVRQRGWYADGKREYVYEYADGKPVRERAWHANGKRRFVREYADGKQVRGRAWYADGKRQFVREYVDGQRVRVRVWDTDGKLVGGNRV